MLFNQFEYFDPTYFLLLSSLLFLIGAAIGSFLNVVIYRSVYGESWVKGRSKCEECNKKISWYDNIPLLSYILLRGKCRNCKTKISVVHPVVELITGALFVWWYWIGSLFFQIAHEQLPQLQTIQSIFWLVVGVLLIIILVADLLYMIIPDIAVGSLFVITLLYRITLVYSGVMKWEDFVLMMVSMVVLVSFFWFLWWVTKGKGFGFGDVKFAAPMALLLGYPKIIVGVLLAFVFGSIVGIVILIFSKKKRGILIPFGPFLVMGTVTALLWGERIWQWYMGLLY